ncbi:MAG: MBL fold metallo-hydrolase [Halalkalicoccus sp.]
MSEPARIPVGAGTPEGINSAYHLPDRGVVVDPGPPTDAAWDTLTDALGSLDDVECVLVTHWHADHAGLACRLAEAAGATIHMHAADAPLVGAYAAERERRLERDVAALRRWGVPEDRRAALVESDTPSALPGAYDVREHEDGETVAGVEFLHTPGHTLGHTSFVAGGTLLLGDLLLPTYTPNVGGSDTRIDDPLSVYLPAIDRVNARFDSGEPGHGTTMDVDRAVQTVKTHHRERATAAFAAVERMGAATPWAVACDLFGGMDGLHVKFGAGEAAAHLERLAALALLERRGEDPVRYRARVPDYPSGLNLTP